MEGTNRRIEAVQTKKYTVIQWATGDVGMHALRGIIQHPRLELCGLWVYSHSKAGRDAGELCGEAHTGVEATNDVDAILALDADCVCYAATDNNREEEALSDLCRILESGKNVVSTSITSLAYPPLADASVIERLTKACIAGQSSLHTTGFDPGFINEVLLSQFTSVSRRVDSVQMQEIIDLSPYGDPIIMQAIGLGLMPEDDDKQDHAAVIDKLWGPGIHFLADALNVELEDRRYARDVALTDDELEVAAMTVAPGGIAAVRYRYEGIVGGQPRICVEHIYRLSPTVAPEWPQPPGLGGYRYTIEGEPRLSAEFSLVDEDSHPLTDVLIGTAMRPVNSIPAVCDAQPGIITYVDLPPISGVIK